MQIQTFQKPFNAENAKAHNLHCPSRIRFFFSPYFRNFRSSTASYKYQSKLVSLLLFAYIQRHPALSHIHIACLYVNVSRFNSQNVRFSIIYRHFATPIMKSQKYIYTSFLYIIAGVAHNIRENESKSSPMVFTLFIRPTTQFHINKKSAWPRLCDRNTKTTEG